MKKNLLLLLFWCVVGSLLSVSAQTLPNLPELKPNRFNSKGQRHGKWVIWRNKTYGESENTTAILEKGSSIKFTNTLNPDSVLYYGYLTFRNGMPIDTFKMFYRSGKPYFVGKLSHFELDTLDGYCTWFDEEGKLARGGLYVCGRREGRHFEYNWIIKTESFYNKGKLDTMKFYEDSVLIGVLPTNGQAWERSRKPNTDFETEEGIIATGLMQNRRREGLWTCYYPDSSIRRQEFYQNGILSAEDSAKMKQLETQANFFLLLTKSDTTPVRLRKLLNTKNYLYHEKLRKLSDYSNVQTITNTHLYYAEIALLESEAAFGIGHQEYFEALHNWHMIHLMITGNNLESYNKIVAAKKAWDRKTTKKTHAYSRMIQRLINVCGYLEQYQEAEHYLEELVAIGPSDMQLYQTQIDFYEHIKEYKKAITLVKKELSRYDAQHYSHKYNILSLASFYRNLGQLDSAIITIGKLLETKRPHDSIYVFYMMSRLYERAERFDSSKIMSERALAGFRAKKNLVNGHDMVALIDTNDIKYNLYFFGKDDIPQCIALTEKQYQERDVLRSKRAGLLSTLYGLISDFKKSKLYFEVYKNSIVKSVGTKHTDYFSMLDQQANLDASMGDTQKALNLLEAIYQDSLLPSKLKPDIAQDLSKLYKTLGQYEAAFQLDTIFLADAKSKYGEKSVFITRWLRHIGKYYILKNDYAKAIDYYDNAKQIVEKSFGKYLAYAIRLKAEAIIHEKQNAFSMALQCQDSASLIFRQTVGESSVLHAQLLMDQSRIYRKIGNYPKAFELNHKARSILKKNSPDTLTFDYQQNNAELFYLQLLNNAPNKVFASIQTHYNSFLKHIDKGFNSLNRSSDGDKSKAQLLQARLAVFNTYKTVAYQLAARSKPEMTDFLYNMALFQKEIVLNDVRFIRLMETASDSTTFELFQQWQKLNYQTLNAPFGLDSEGERADWRNDSILCTQRFETLLKRSKIFKQTRAIVHWKEVQARLKDGEVAIEYDMVPLTDSEKTLYYALLLQKNAPSPVFLPLFDEKELKTLLDESQIADTQNAVITRYNNGGYGGGELYQLVWYKIDSVLKRSKKPIHTIFLATTGLLENISFDILPTRRYSNPISQPDTLLLSDLYKIYRVRSTRELVISNLGEPIKDNPKVLLYGSINYNSDSTVASAATGNKGGYFHATTMEPVELYPSMQDETRQVQQICAMNHASVTVQQGNDATEGHFKALNRPFDILHFNTHGFYIENGLTDPLYRSYLAMAGCNKYLKNPNLKMVEDGLLTAHEIALVDLTQTQLVVLSACQTALGDIQGSEGVYGLRRALRLAGSDFILVSLWSVPSEATTAFMTLFYQNLLRKMPIRTAFEQTQKTMRQNYPNPEDKYHWAAWVLIR